MTVHYHTAYINYSYSHFIIYTNIPSNYNLYKEQKYLILIHILNYLLLIFILNLHMLAMC